MKISDKQKIRNYILKYFHLIGEKNYFEIDLLREFVETELGKKIFKIGPYVEELKSDKLIDYHFVGFNKYYIDSILT